MIKKNTLRATALLALLLINCEYRKEKEITTPKAEERYVFTHSDSVISIEKVNNYCNVKRQFTLTKEVRARITSCGEIVVGEKNNKRDVLEMYFDLNNEKKVGYDSKINKFFFFSEIGGSSSNVESKFSDIAPNLYTIEISLPWKEIGVKPVLNKIMGFDFALTDNDNGFEQEKQIAWHADDSDIWLNSSLWGNIKLVKHDSEKAINDSTVLSVYTPVKPLIDGKSDDIYKKSLAFATKNVLYGTVSNRDNDIDILGELRSCWDNDNLYFFIMVKDNKVVKQSFMGKEFDFGWVEKDGEVVWRMNRSNSYHAGGALKNHCADTILSLRAGSYYLCFQSDESHSYNHWEDTPPLSNFYGIRLSKLKDSHASASKSF